MKKPTKTGASLSDKWYDRLNYQEWWAEVPLVTKTKGRTKRLELPVYDTLANLAISVRESYPALFANTVEVHRAAHYLGIFILKTALTLQSEKKLVNVCADLAIKQEGDRFLLTILSQLKSGWDLLGEKYHAGLINETALVREAVAQTEMIPMEQRHIAKTLAEEYIAADILSPDATRKIKERLRKERVRAKKESTVSH